MFCTYEMLSDSQNELSLDLIYIIYSKFLNFFYWKLKLLFYSFFFFLVSVYTGCINWVIYGCIWGFPGGASGKEPTCRFRRHERCGFDPWVGKTPGGGNGHLLQWTEEPGRLQSIGSPRVGHNWSNLAHTYGCIHVQSCRIRSAPIASIFWKNSCEISIISPLNVERNSLVKPSRPWVFYVEKILTMNSISLMDLGSVLLICIFLGFIYSFIFS